jgi:hypothetical protein
MYLHNRDPGGSFEGAGKGAEALSASAFGYLSWRSALMTTSTSVTAKVEWESIGSIFMGYKPITTNDLRAYHLLILAAWEILGVRRSIRE